MKLRNGSLRDFTPDHYPLGYMLVAYGREKYGDDFWRNVSHDAASFKGLFYPLQKAIKRYSGISFEQFRTDALGYFSADIKKESTADSSAIYAREHAHFVADEEFPQFIDADHIVYSRTTYKQPPAFLFAISIPIKKERSGQDLFRWTIISLTETTGSYMQPMSRIFVGHGVTMGSSVCWISIREKISE